MELPSQEGGTGGKFRRRQVRRPSPYDRPPSAVRGLRGLTEASRSGSGWLSKLVDPASRFITGSASKIFQSVFRKRLTGPPDPEGSEQNLQVKLHVTEAMEVTQNESQVQDAVDGHYATKSFEADGLSEIEQLLKEKKYTRAQVDYLTGLICSRTVEPTGQESEGINEKIHVSNERVGVKNSILNRNLSTSKSDLNIPRDAVSSPAEIAKAYMSSRFSQASPAIGLQSQEIQEDKGLRGLMPSVAKPHDMSVAPRSPLGSSEIRELSSVGYSTNPRGKNAIYRMARSPYFRPNLSANMKVNAYTTTSICGPPSLLASGSASKSDGRQVLKRDRSYLDNEYGCLGPIRRIRQKSGLNSSSSARALSSKSTHSYPLIQYDKHDLKKPTFSQKVLSPNELNYAGSGLPIEKNSDNKMSSLVPPVPMQSSEACRKILEHLDKIVPSQEDKCNKKVMFMNESPSKLTTDMLNIRALRSMENIEDSQFINVIGTSGSSNVKDPQKNIDSQSEKQKLSKALDNDSSKLDIQEVKFEMASNGGNKQDGFNKISRPIIISADVSNVIPAKVPTLGKPAFQMIAPEELLEIDDEEDVMDVPVQPTVSTYKPECEIVKAEASVSTIPAPEQPLLPFSKNPMISDSKKESSFSFPVATVSSGFSTPPLMPTIPIQSHDKFQSRIEESAAPAFAFGDQNSCAVVPSPATVLSNDASVEYKPDQRLGSKIISENTDSFSSSKIFADGLHKDSVMVAMSGKSSSVDTNTINFGSSITSATQSNSSVHASSSPSPFSASTPVAILRSPVIQFSSDSSMTFASSSSPAISSSLPTFSSADTFKFGASSSSSPVSISLSSDTSNSVNTQGNMLSKSSFGSFTLPTTQAVSSFISTGNNSTAFIQSSPFPDSGSIRSVETIPFSSMNRASNSPPKMSSTFSGLSSSGPSFAALPAISTKTTDLFTSNISSQTNSTSVSLASSSSQKSSTIFGAGGGSLTQPSSSNAILSQSSGIQPSSFSSSSKLGSSSSSIAMFSNPSSYSAFGSNNLSSARSEQVLFGTANQSAKPFDSTSSSSISTAAASTASSSGFPFSSVAGVSGASPPFFFSSTAGTSTSNSGHPFSISSSASSSSFSFTYSGSSSNPAGNIYSPAATTGLFGSRSLGLSSSNSSSNFGSSPAMGFSFGLKPPASVSSLGFGSLSGPAFSFTSSGIAMSAATVAPTFTIPSASGGFTSASQNNDHMSVEDTMADDTTNPSPVSMVPTFGLSSSAQSPNFVFGSGAPLPGAAVAPFQFGGHQNHLAHQNPNLFQAGGNLEFPPGGSFSLGSGGGDKAARKIVKVRRDKARRK